MTKAELDAIIAGVAATLAGNGVSSAPLKPARQAITMPDKVKLPEDELHRKLFCLIFATALQNVEDGYGPLPAGWRIAKEIEASGVDFGGSDNVRRLYLELELGGFIRILPSKGKRGGFLYLPVALDNGTGRSKAAKSTQASSVARTAADIETRFMTAAGVGQSKKTA